MWAGHREALCAESATSPIPQLNIQAFLELPYCIQTPATSSRLFNHLWGDSAGEAVETVSRLVPSRALGTCRDTWVYLGSEKPVNTATNGTGV